MSAARCLALLAAGTVLLIAIPGYGGQATQPESRAGAAALIDAAGIEVFPTSFSPTAGDKVMIRLPLTGPAQVTVLVYGPNQELIARAAENRECAAGLNALEWDGRDLNGQIVPDEAYFFTIRAVAQDRADLWDPLMTSGGERIVAGELQAIDQNRFTYQLPRACRTLVRAAIPEGPLVRTIVNWEARPAGLCLERWDGLDADGLRRVADIGNVRIGVMAFALPAKSVITIGNRQLDYRTYYRDKGRLLTRKERVVRAQESDTLISPHWLMPPHLNRDPELTMQFMGIEPEPQSRRALRGATTGTSGTSAASLPHEPAGPSAGPSLSQDHLPGTRPAPASAPGLPPPVRLSGGSALVRVDLPDPDERTFMNNQKFELIVYLDDKRVLELEQGHVPFNYPLDLATLKPGRHLLTFNVSSFRNHVGTVSRYVEVAR